MLLSDRSFVDSGVVLAFQKTAAYHVLVVVGLHVGCEFLLPGDIEKKLKMSWSPRGTPCRAFSESSASWEQDVLDRCVVDAVASRIAVVSFGGGNQFGHSLDAVVTRYVRSETRFLRTDRDGLLPRSRMGMIRCCVLLSKNTRSRVEGFFKLSKCFCPADYKPPDSSKALELSDSDELPVWYSAMILRALSTCDSSTKISV
jgi:hypothetical protein